MSSIIRLKQSQINNWESKNIMIDEIPPTFDCKGNFTAKVLKSANKLGIRFKNSIIKKILQWKEDNFFIQNGIANDKIYKKSISSLKKRQLMYIDQLIDTDLKILFKWNFIKILDKVSKRGPEPLWYKRIQEKITTNGTKIRQEWSSIPWQTN